MSLLCGATYKTTDPSLKSKQKVLDAFMGNKDFLVSSSRASRWIRINRPQIERENVHQVRIRYAQDRKVVFLSRGEGSTNWKIK